MSILLVSKINNIVLLLGGLLLFSVFQVTAQEQASKSSGAEIRPLQQGTRIWAGTAALSRQTTYFPGTEGARKNVQTLLDVQLRWLRFTGPYFGWGLQGVGELFMSGTFGYVSLGTLGVGPVLRGYPWQNKRWQTYLQGGLLAGYDLALGDALGANSGQGMRYRPGLRAGLTYRVSNAFGIYLETGPDWEADEAFQFDSRAWRLNIGIELFRF